MMFFKLAPTTYQPNTTIENFETLAWTERYQSPGDFKLVVDNEINILTTFPYGTLVSHTDTRAVGIVENHEIERDKDKNLKITISGRTFETFLEERVTAGSLTALYTTGIANVQTTGVISSCHAALALINAALTPGTATANDQITNFSASETMRVHPTAMNHVIKRGDVYGNVLELSRIAKAGIKSERPASGVVDTLKLIVHDGVDRIGTVIFYAQSGDLEDAKYFWSNKNYRNYAQIATHITARLYKNRDIATTPTGLDRRVVYVEANDLEGAYSPPTATDVVAGRAQGVLDETVIVSLLQAKIAATAKPKFKIDYDVGDLVKVYGEFSSNTNMRVTEHILTVDKNGTQGYPSLSAV